MFADFHEIALRFLPLVLTIAAVAVIMSLVNWGLKRRWRDDPDAQFRFQLIMLALSLASLLAIVVALPVGDALRGQLLSLIGILLSAAIALSSTTFIGNVMAGVMLKVMRNARPGDFITVEELTGRITEMDLLHTEIQTEFRDLVTVPNLYMVTKPMRVVRASGTIITGEVSLGYEVSHRRAAKLLRSATERAGLSEGFVQVRELGDFSVTYRVAGLLEDVKSLISARSKLRESMLDALHEAGVEIVSPNFMNTRALQAGDPIIPEPERVAVPEERISAEEIVFDKAEEAASIETIRKSIEHVDAELEALADDEPTTVEAEKARLNDKRAALVEQLRLAEEALKAKEKAENGPKESG